MSRPYNNKFSKHVRRVAALARLKGPDPTPPNVHHIVGAGAEERKKKVLADHAEQLERATARFVGERAVLEMHIAKGAKW